MTATVTDPRLPEGSGLIGGEMLHKTSGGSATHVDAATGRPGVLVSLAGADEVDAAVAAAQSAQASWGVQPGSERRRALQLLAQVLRDNADELDALQVFEAGLGARYTVGTSRLVSEWFDYYAGYADKIESRVIPPGMVPGLSYTLSEPYGVVGQIVPFNAPVVLMVMGASAMLAAGNCVVVKPSELAPFSILRFAELALEAGFPPGVINVVPGGRDAGDRLVRHPGVGKVSFTGGGETARAILQAASEGMKPVSLELGGKSAHLMFSDADLDTAVPFAAAVGMLVLSGQACTAATRLLVERPIYEDVLARLEAIAKASPMGHPSDPDTVVGPLVTQAACERVLGMIAEAESSARLVAGGRRATGELAEGFYIEPTVFADVPPDSALAQNEVFGPVLSVIPFEDEEEGIRIANSTRYGLASFVSSGDVTRVHRVAAQLAAGKVYVNGFDAAPPGNPVGGYRESGFGRVGGEVGLREYLQTKNVFVQLKPAAAH